MKEEKTTLRSQQDHTINSAENNESDLLQSAPKFNPTAQLKSNTSEAEGSLSAAPFQMRMEEEEEGLQMKQAPFQMLAEEEEEGLQMKSSPFQMKHEDEEEEVQMKQGKGSPDEKRSENATKASLPDKVQGKMESSMNADFSNVDVYSNSEKASGLGAQAFAQGNEIHFAPGKYNPESQNGQELIGHELTHVVQQRENRVSPSKQLKGHNVNNDSALENEADVMGKKAANGQPTQMKTTDKKSGHSTEAPIQGFGFGDAIDWVGDKAGDAAEWVGDKAEDVADTVNDKAGEAKDWMEDKAGDAAGTAENAFDLLKNTFQKGKNFVKDTGKKALNFGKKLIGKGKGAIEKGLEWVTNKGSKVWDLIKDKVESVKDKLTGGAKMLINFVISIGGAVKDKVLDFIDAIRSGGENLWNSVKSNLNILKKYFQRIAIPDAEILGSYQANQAQTKLWEMGPVAFIKFYKTTIGKAKNNRERQYILKALAAGNSVSAIESFANTIRGKSKSWMRNNLRLTRQTDGKGLRQSWNDSCGPTTVQAIQGELDPIYALSLRNSNGTDINNGNGVVLATNQDVIEDQRDMLENNGGVAVSRGSAGGQGMGMGDMMTLIKSRTGIDYSTTGASNKTTALAEIDGILAQGLPVPIRVGGSAAAPWGGGHFSLITHKSGSTYNFHDVWQGQSYGRSKANFTTNSMNIATWQIFTHYGKPATDD